MRLTTARSLVLLVGTLVVGARASVKAQSGCSQVDLVFVMDTSSSMTDEIGSLCELIVSIASRLEDRGVNVEATLLGITGTRFCLTSTVGALLGTEVPGDDPGCGATLRGLESWGPATAIVAERFAWRPGSSRIIVPLSDEGPCRGGRNGSGCNADDDSSIQNAIALALANRVTVSPILGTGVSDCIVERAEDLAASTGGLAFLSPNLQASSAVEREEARENLIEAVGRLVVDACSDTFLRADANVDLEVNISDPVFTLQMLFTGGRFTSCFDAADSNGDKRVDMSDPIFTLNYLFLRGPAPGAPFPVCGRDPRDGAADCIVGCRAS